MNRGAMRLLLAAQTPSPAAQGGRGREQPKREANREKAIPGDGMNRHFFTLFCLLGVALALRADNWPGWRGPAGDGLSAEKDLPVRWSATESVRWKVPL